MPDSNYLFKMHEDPAVIQHVKASLLETPHLRSSMKFHHNIFETKMIPIVGEFQIVSPTTSLDGFEAHQPPDELLMVGGVNAAGSQAQGWQFMDEDFSTQLHHSVNSGGCISQTFIDLGNVTQCPLEKDERKGNRNELGLNVQNDDFHYQSILLNLLKTSKEFIFGPKLERFKRESSFQMWMNGGPADCRKQRCGTPQRILKCVLFEVPRMHVKGLTESSIECSGNKNGAWEPEADEISTNHVIAKRRRRDKIKKQLSTLKSIIPSVNKVLNNKSHLLRVISVKFLRIIDCSESLNLITW